MNERLYRSTTDKFIAGVCGGLAEYFRVDPSIVRVLFVLLSFASGVGLITYLVMCMVVPKRPVGTVSPTPEHLAGWNSYLPGVILVGIGVLMLVIHVFRWINWHMIWPVIVILIGLALVFYHGGRSTREHHTA